MGTLSRYIFREMISPTLIGFGFYTFVILMRQLFEIAEMIIKKSLPFWTVLELLLLSLPHIVVLTIPMSLLFGILIAIGRLSSDSEIIAMKSAGIAASSIYRPVFLFSFLVFLINLFLMNYLLPRGNTRLQLRKAELLTSAVEREIKPRVFYNEYVNRVIYVDDIDLASGQWKGVFLSDTSDPLRPRVVTAERGRLALSGDGSQIWLDLQNAETHFFSWARPERYDLSTNREQRMLLHDRQDTSQPRTLQEMSYLELRRNLRKEVDPLSRRELLVEMQKKFSIPFACLAFGVIGLPLGITNRRGGKSSGFSLSIAIILVYYVLMNNGEDLARTGALNPILAMWAPNVLLVIFGLVLLRRANTDAGAQASGITLIERLGRLLGPLRRKKARATTAGEEESSLASSFDIAFPNTLDRYILREFLKLFALVLISTVALFIIVDYTELAGHVNKNQIPFAIVASYYRYYLFQVLHWTLPLSVLLSTLITFGMFSRNNEITAMKSNGVSLYRISVPVLAIAGVVSLMAYFLLDFVLPYANERTVRLKAVIKGRAPAASTFTVEQRQWVFGEGRYLFNFLSVDERKRTLSQVQVFELDPQTFQLRRRVVAQQARFNGAQWVFSNGWIREFAGRQTTFTPLATPTPLRYPERPEYFAAEGKLPSQMSYLELSRYVRDLRRSGYAADDLAVRLFEKTSWPFVSLVMAIIALPFSFRIGKQGSLHGVAIALVLAFIYWMFFALFTKLGEVGSLPAILAAWSANILFLISATYMLLHVET